MVAINPTGAGNMENVGYAKEGKAGVYNILIMEEVQSIAACGAGAEHNPDNTEFCPNCSKYTTKIYFLKKNNILSKYIRYCIANKSKGEPTLFVDEYTITNFPTIIVAFSWENTPEGYRYWSDYYRKFENCYKKFAYEYHL